MFFLVSATTFTFVAEEAYHSFHSLPANRFSRWRQYDRIRFTLPTIRLS
jgi:hypothetical protein